MARSFNRTNLDHLTKGSVSPSPITGFPHTLFFRAKLAAFAANDRYQVISVANAANDTNYIEFGFFNDNAGDISIFITNRPNGSESFFFDTTTRNLDQIYSAVVVQRSATDREIFVDGISEGTNSTDLAIPTGLDRISIGRNTRLNPIFYFNGTIYEAGISNSAWNLSDAKMFAAGVPGSQIRPASLTGYWPLWGQSPEPDIAPAANKNALTVTGATFVTGGIQTSYAPFKPTNQASILRSKTIPHFYAEQLSEVTQSNTTMTTKLSIPASFFVPFGKYLIITSSQIGEDSTTNLSQVQLTFNGDAPLLGSFLDYRMRGTETGRRKIYHDVRVVEANETPTSFDFQIANNSTSTTRASNTQMIAIRLDKHFRENIDYFYKEEVGTISMDPVTGRNMKSVFTDAFNLASAEDFHVMGTCRYLTPSTTQRGFINVQENKISLAGGGEVANVANTRLNQTFHKIKNLASGINHRFNMDTQNGSSGAVTFSEFVSVFAIKTSILEDLLITDSQSGSLSITGADTYQTLQSGLFTPTQGGPYVVLYAARFIFQSGSTLGSRKANLRFQLDSVSNPLNIDVNTLTDVQGVDDSPSVPMFAYYGDLPTVSHNWKSEAKNQLASQLNVDGGTVLMFSLLPLRRFVVRGIVQENGSNVSRTVRAFLSSTGEFLGETTSHPDTGAYEITDIPGGNIFVVAFDDSSGDSFNALVFDKVIPV